MNSGSKCSKTLSGAPFPPPARSRLMVTGQGGPTGAVARGPKAAAVVHRELRIQTDPQPNHAYKELYRPLRLPRARLTPTLDE